MTIARRFAHRPMPALHGINVLEIDSTPAAAYAAMLLAENGARALRVERRGGSPWRGSAHFAILNRSKRAIELNLESASGRDRLKDLIRACDILIHAFGPARAKEIGCDFAAVREINRRVDVVSIPPLGNAGPYAESNATDELV